MMRLKKQSGEERHRKYSHLVNNNNLQRISVSGSASMTPNTNFSVP